MNPRLRLRAATRRRAATDDGFGLAEAVVALGIMAGLLLALLSTSVFAVRATTEARRNQQAADYLNAAVEAVRSLDFGSIAMRTTQVASAPRVVAGKFDPGTGAEPVHATAGGAVAPAVQTVSADNNADGRTDNGTYELRRWVTRPADATVAASGIPSVVRVTVEVVWSEKGRTRSRQSSTLVTNTRRGLPLPNYTYSYAGPAPLLAGRPHWVKNPGADIDFGMVLTNLGARDSWTLTASTPGWSFYRDTNEDGIWSEDLAVEPLVAPPNTGLIEPNGRPVRVVAQRTTLDSTSPGTYSTTFTARSDAQPTYPVKSFVAEYELQTGVVVQPTTSATPTPSPTATPTGPATTCQPGTATAISGATTEPTAATTNGGHSLTPYYLYNGPELGDTASKATNTLGPATSGLQASPCNWSTEAGLFQAGRALPVGARAEWTLQPTSANDSLRGKVAADLYVQCAAAVNPGVTVAVLRRTSTGTETSLGSVSVPVTCPTTSPVPFVRVDAGISIPNTTLALTDRLVLRVTTNAAVRLMYGTSGAPSRLVVGVK